MSSETVFPQVMTNAATGERQTIQLTPREGLTLADVEAFLAERREAGKLIDPMNCELTKVWGQVLDPYGLFDVPEGCQCYGSDLFVRNLPDGKWVWDGDLPEEIAKALTA
jgi:hypothetical protein